MVFFRTTTIVLLLKLPTLSIGNLADTGGKSPQLNYVFQGNEEGTTANKSPFVTIDNILPKRLLNAVLDEILDNCDDPGDCELRRDELHSNEERWLDLTLEQCRSGEYDLDDIFEQAVAEIALYDMMHVLPERVASQIRGVSWRILTGYSGDNKAVFHYDSDEGIDYAIDEVPVVHPVLSTVTYLTDYGEPTLIFEQFIMRAAHLNSTEQGFPSSTDYLMPRAAYVVMPNANKHLAFDPRLYHGSGSNMSKYPATDEDNNWRIVIGTNYHTHHTMETYRAQKNAELVEAELIAPIDKGCFLLKGDREEQRDVEQQCRADMDAAVIHIWNPADLIPVEERVSHNFTQWEYFRLNLAKLGLDFCQHLAPCQITVRLPTQQLLSNEYDDNMRNGSNYGFEITPEDFIVTPDNSEKGREQTAKWRKWRHTVRFEKDYNEVNLATRMLTLRCKMYDHHLLDMNPPAMHEFCSGSNGQMCWNASTSITNKYPGIF